MKYLYLWVMMSLWFQEKLKLVTVLGAGLLVGTALAVIIPEGVNAMYNGGGGKSQSHSTLTQSLDHILNGV